MSPYKLTILTITETTATQKVIGKTTARYITQNPKTIFCNITHLLFL